MIQEWIPLWLQHSPLFTAFSGANALNTLSIPMVAAFIGWFTNWLAIQMSFWPIEFIGIRPFLGWQGVIPSKTEKISGIMVDKSISKLGTLKELFQYLEPEKIAAHIQQHFQDNIEHYIDEIMLKTHAIFWENLPRRAKNRIYQYIKDSLPELSERITYDIAQKIEELVNLKQMVSTLMKQDKKLMNRIFMEVGANELRFVVRSGLYFGLPFGIIQMIIWIYFPIPGLLPFCGFLVGYITNWLALNCIFRPLHPIQIGRFSIQGLFLKRQNEVAEKFCHLVTRELLSLERIMHYLFNDLPAQKTQRLIKQHLKPVIESSVIKIPTQLMLGSEGYAQIKQQVEIDLLEMIQAPFKDKLFNEQRAQVAEKIFYAKMSQMNPEEFQDLLRPAFQEDEWILVLIGAILGMVAGFIQLLFM